MNEVLLGLAFLATLALGLFPLFKPVDWAEDLGPRATWQRVSFFVTGFSLVAVGLVGLVTFDLPALRFMATATAVGLSSLLLGYSLVTDYRLRLVDRRINNAATVLTGIIGTVLIVHEQAWITASVAITIAAFAGFLYLFAINSVGAGDVRALFLVGLGIVPVIGWNGFVWASLFAGVYFIVIGLGVAFVKRTTRSSFPAVPMLVFPYWAVLLLMQFVILPSAFPTVAI